MFTKMLRYSSVLALMGLSFLSVAFAAPQFSSIDVVSDNANTAVAKAGDVLTFTLSLSPDDDANGVGQINFDIGATTGLTTSTFAVSGSSGTHQVDYTVLAGQDGLVSVSGITFQNSLNEDIQSLPSFPYTPSPNVEMDTTASSVTSATVVTSGNGDFARETETVTYTVNFSEDVTITLNAASSASNITTLTTELDASIASTDDLVFTVVSGDNGTVTPVVDFDITDGAGNVTSITDLGTITGGPAVTDTTAPNFSAVNVASDNVDPTIAVEGDIITFSLDLSSADTWSAANRINFDIGSNSFQTPFFASDASPDASKSVTFTVPSGEDGVISVTGISFTDFAGNALAGFTPAYTPSPNVDVDSVLPTAAEVTPVTNPTNDNTPAYTFNSSETGTISYTGDCSSATTSAVSGNNTVDFNTLSDGTHSNCTIQVVDDHGNESGILNVSSFDVDAIAPTITSATVVTSGNGDFARETETVTYTVNFSEDVTITLNAASSASNITTLTTELDASIASTDDLVFTVVSGDNGTVTPVVDFDITDGAGNVTSITDLGTITGGPAVTDTTAPNFSAVNVASDNVDPTIAVEGDIITFSLDLSSADTWSAANRINFDIGSNSFQTPFFASDASPDASKSVTFTVPSGEDGVISVTGISFTDFAGNALAGFTPAYTPSPNVDVDSVLPTAAEVTPVTNPTNDNTPAYTFNSSETGTISYTGDCSSATTSAVSGNNTVDFNTLSDGTHSNCTIQVVDDHGNESGILNVSSFDVDAIAPTITSATVVTSGNGDFARETETVTYTVNFSEDVTITLNAASSASNITTLTTELDASIASTDDLVFTVVSGDNGTVTPVVDFDITDGAGNVTSITDLGTITGGPAVTDTTAPNFSAVNVASDNVDPTIAVEGDIITFSLDLSSADTWSAANRINFDIGSNSFQTPFFASDASPDASKSVTFTVPSGEDGVISVTGISFTDFAGNALAGFTPAYTPSPNVDVDSVLPTAAEVTPVTNPTNDNTPAYTFSSSEAGTISYTGDCSSATTSAVVGNNTVDFNTLADGIHSNCTVRVTDDHGNQSSLLDVSSFEIDTVDPTITSATVVTSGNGNFAKETETVTYTVNFSEDIALTINTTSSASNITTLTTELDASSTNSDELVFTAVDGDNGTVSPVLDFDISDAAGNVVTITDFGTITGGPAVTDTTAPTLSPVGISSNNANPAYAKTNDTVTIDFTSSETITNQSGTIFGEVSVLSNTSGNVWNSALLTDGDEAEGTVAFTLDFEDLAGNVATQVVATTEGSSVIFDRTNPTLEPGSVTIISDNPYVLDAPTYYAREGNEITLNFETVETVQEPTGTLLGRAATFENTSGNMWTAKVTGNGADTEGTTAIDIHIHDLAGNNTLNITTTMDGTSVLYDRTAPTLPTIVNDLGGLASDTLKHFSEGVFSWSGIVDLGSGIYQHIARLENTAVGINESQTLDSATTEFTPTNFVAEETPYNFYLNLRDKAGNESGESLVYEQRYGVKIQGIARGKDSGKFLVNAFVTVISAFGTECNVHQEICATRTDDLGRYEILAFPNKAYKMDFVAFPNFYLEKIDIVSGIQDVFQNAQLALIESLQAQTGSQTISVVTSKEFGTGQRTEILISSLSGEAEVSNSEGGILITSFGRITSVSSNNPEVEIQNQGNNRYLVKNAGSIKLKVDAFTKLKPTKSNFASGETRLGVVFVAGNGSKGLTFPGVTRAQRKQILDRQISYKRSLELAMAQNEGSFGQVNYYTNRNGHKVFAGYIKGKVATKVLDRFRTNHVAFRGVKKGRDWNAAYVAVKKISGEKESFKASAPESKAQGRNGSKIDHNDMDATIRAIKKRREYKKAKVNKFARVEDRKQVKSRIKPRWEGRVVRDRRTGGLVSVKSRLEKLKVVQGAKSDES